MPDDKANQEQLRDARVVGVAAHHREADILAPEAVPAVLQLSSLLHLHHLALRDTAVLRRRLVGGHMRLPRQGTLLYDKTGLGTLCCRQCDHTRRLSLKI